MTIITGQKETHLDTAEKVLAFAGIAIPPKPEPDPIPCPKCASTETGHHHADTPNCVGVETDWEECEACGHQWNHQ
jgi:DNA-directed RNA polymerase subunit M/transcription elongation factor TFIIS